MAPRRLLKAVVAAAAVALTVAECPNSCSGKGDCSTYDMCTCFVGYQGNDCSERICPFGRAHVDGHTGDLDSDNDRVDTLVTTQMFNRGSTENTGIFLGAISMTANTAHNYMECSNKGVCDRATGACTCFTAFEGSACERASCPNSCSGHGVCKTNRELAKASNTDTYEKWDSDSGMACACDAGYQGNDCSERQCPYGKDPLVDDSVLRPTVYTFKLADTGAANSGAVAATGTYRIKVYDNQGEDWVTTPITWSNTASTMAAAIQAALIALPNQVVPTGTVTCTDNTGALKNAASYDGSTSAVLDYSYTSATCTFTGMYGMPKPPVAVVTDFEGKATIIGTGGYYDASNSKILFNVFDEGVYPEDTDYFPTKCTDSGTTVIITVAEYAGTVAFYRTQAFTVTTGSASGLKKCLAGSSPSPTLVEVENWEYGNLDGGASVLPGTSPHIAKLVPTGSGNPVNAVFYYSSTGTAWIMMNRVTPGTYYVYTTTGYLERVFFGTSSTFANDLVTLPGAISATKYTNYLYLNGDVTSSAGTAIGQPTLLCQKTLGKNDIIVIPHTFVSANQGTVAAAALFGTDTGTAQTAYPFKSLLANVANMIANTAGLYKIKAITTTEAWDSHNFGYRGSTIEVDRPLFWTAAPATYSATENIAAKAYPIFKFTPPSTAGTYYKYVDECSGRGACDRTLGACVCYKGYYGSACGTQSSIAV